jgi:hypothetical protein
MLKGSDMQNRAEMGPEPVKAKDETKERLRELERRIEAARLTRKGEERHCVDCFRRGRDAALKIIDGG